MTPPSALVRDAADRKMWLMLRRALLLAVKAIELRYGNESTKEHDG